MAALQALDTAVATHSRPAIVDHFLTESVAELKQTISTLKGIHPTHTGANLTQKEGYDFISCSWANNVLKSSC